MVLNLVVNPYITLPKVDSIIYGRALSQSHRYHRRVFLTPPWPEIYVTDPERRHGLEKALAEYCRLLEVESALGCAIGFSSTASDVPEPMKSSDEGNSRVS